MVMSTVTKNKFSQLNDKRFYIPNGIVSLPFHHTCLAKINELKQKKEQKIKKYFLEEKGDLIRLENEALRFHPRLYLYHQILMSTPKIFDINQKTDFKKHTKSIFKKNTKDIILEGAWLMK